MKKLICFILALCIITSTAMAAPYRLEYFNTTKFHVQSLREVAKNHNVDLEYKKVASGVSTTDQPISGNSGITDSSVDTSVDSAIAKDYKTMSDVVGALCVITGVTKTLYNDEKMTQLTYYVNNSPMEYSCYISDDSRVYAGKYDVEDINVGSLVYINVKEGGVVNRYSVVAVMDNVNNAPVIDASALKGTYKSSKINLVYSYIVDYHNVDDNIVIEVGNDYALVATEQAKLYTVDINRKNTEVVSGECFAEEIYEATYDEQTDKTTAYMIFAIEYDDEAVFVCSYTTPVEIDGDVTY